MQMPRICREMSWSTAVFLGGAVFIVIEETAKKVIKQIGVTYGLPAMVGSLGICLCCVPCIFLCVTWCCCCAIEFRNGSGQGVVNGPLPPMVASEAAPQYYQGPEPVVFVMAQVVGQEGKRNEQIA
ncbi:unnamed protein product [Symbiodinium microadriaticum]|nr:unnamed protein product [Symbiodinium microadriaticum]